MPEADLLVILKRALFAWLIADGDMHLKNLALLKAAAPGADTFESVRMVPLYDAVTTRVFPCLENGLMALRLNGKDDRLRRADFLRMAAKRWDTRTCRQCGYGRAAGRFCYRP